MEHRRNDLSILGFGCMRFPKDIKETERELKYAIEHGVNYFDTAYIYPGNEKILGELVEKNGWREQIQIATKMPHYLINSVDDMEKKFQEQLQRLRTDYVDQYLMHMLPDVGIWNKLIDMGVLEWIKEKKACGQIRKIGFSYHGNTENFIKLIDAYDWEFCQVQYNYMDENSQAGRRGVQYAGQKGVPVIIMEPLRGGKLVHHLPKKAMWAFKKGNPDWSPAEWGLRWLWDQKEISVVLSGMNSMEMVKENIRIAENVKVGELTKRHFKVYAYAREAINEKMKVPCTGCAYCQPCPKGVDIPGTFRSYNVCHTDGYFVGFREYVMCTTFRAKPTNASLCVQCGKCEKHCPQSIEIRKELKNACRYMETPVYKAVKLGSRFFFSPKARKWNNKKET